MGDRGVITINRGQVFSVEDVRRVLPVVRRITQEFSGKVEILIARLETLELHQTDLICSLENQVNDLIATWNEKIKKLGADPKGLWVVDFDFGQGYYCWKFPETDILYWHDYEDGYTGRKPLEDLCHRDGDEGYVHGKIAHAKESEAGEKPTSDRARSDELHPGGF